MHLADPQLCNNGRQIVDMLVLPLTNKTAQILCIMEVTAGMVKVTASYDWLHDV